MEIAVLPSKNAILLRAVMSLALGAILLLLPGITLIVLIYAFAFNILLTGIVTLFEPKKNHAVVTVILGLIGIIVGIYLIAKPMLTGEIVAFLIAVLAIVYGVVDIYLGFTTKNNAGNLLLVLVGAISILFGIYVLNSPLIAILDLVYVIALYSIIVGLVLGVMGLVFYPKTSSE